MTGHVADENDWTSSGPRIIRPKRTVTGTVIGLFADSRAAVKVETRAGETLCVRVLSCIPPRGKISS
ncbi:MAG: hypothetical protein ACRDPD_02740 [Streptosporangiaceae bacterium]